MDLKKEKIKQDGGKMFKDGLGKKFQNKATSHATKVPP